jgi:excisionase family DNA binding protein
MTTSIDYNAVLTVDQAGLYLRLSSKTVRALIARRQLPAVRIGRLYRIPREALENLLKTAQPPPPSHSELILPIIKQ